MSRNLDASNLTAYGSEHVNLIQFVYLSFGSGDVRVHDRAGSVTWGGNTWTGLGDLGQISLIEEAVQSSNPRIKLTLSGIKSTLINKAIGEEYHGRSAIVYRGTLDSDHQLNADPDVAWSGYIDNMSVSFGQGAGVIEVVCEDERARWNTALTQRYTVADHQERFSGDLFFEYIPQLGEYAVEWGGEVVKEYNYSDNTRVREGRNSPGTWAPR